MAKLNDTQRVLLATAAQRDDHSVYPLPRRPANAGKRVTNAIKALRKQELIEEQVVKAHQLRHALKAEPIDITRLAERE